MKLTTMLAFAVLALSSSAWAAPKKMPGIHESVAQVCAAAAKNVDQANAQYKGKVMMAEGVVSRFDNPLIGDERFRLLSGDNLENMAVVFHYPGTASLKENQRFKVKGVVSEINTDFGCMVMMESGSTH